ncbi:MAG: hypothetical protein IJS60_00085 [Abditibacteriota bacterium]|nr:hypothetical protein [Abditibacteriota bacterium]
MFDLSIPYNVIFMGVFTGVCLALIIRNNLFVYTVCSLVILFIGNYMLVMIRYGDRIYDILGESFGNVFIIAAGILIISVALSSLIVYFIRRFAENRK